MSRKDADLVDALLSGMSPGDPDGACLDANVLAGLAEGTLDEAERDQALGHVARCEACRELAALVADAVCEDVSSTASSTRPAWAAPRTWMALAAVLLLSVGVTLFLSRPGGPGEPSATETLVARALLDLGPRAPAGLDAVRAIPATEMASPGPGTEPLRGGFDILHPAGTTPLERPSFAWAEVAGATAYQVALVGEDGTLWERTTEAPSLEYPADESPLVPGARYVLEVSAQGAAPDTVRRSFGVATKAQATAWEAFEKEVGAEVEEPLVWLVLAHAAIGQAYGDEAFENAKRFAASRPDDAYGKQTLTYVARRFRTR